MYIEELEDDLEYFDDDDIISNMSDEDLEKLSKLLDDLLDLL